MDESSRFWRSVWPPTWGAFSPRRFSSLFGASPVVASIVWSYLSTSPALHALHLLMCLYFLKTYPTWDAGAAFFGITSPTYQRHVKRVMYALASSMHEIDCTQRFHHQCPGGVYLSVDTTLCPIEIDRKDWATQRVFFSGDKWMHGLKYEIAVHAFTGEIMWIRGPWPGPANDKTVLDSLPNNILQPGEMMYGDKGYQGHPRCWTPFKGRALALSLEQWQWNQYLHYIRVRVENSIARVKQFKCLSHKWRNDLELHPVAFAVCAQIAAVSCRVHPVRQDVRETQQ